MSASEDKKGAQEAQDLAKNAAKPIERCANPWTMQSEKHIFEGEIIVKDGIEVVEGYHYRGKDNQGDEETKIVGRSKPAGKGTYKSEPILIKGVEKKRGSTFFPDDWSKEQVIQAILEAYKDAPIKPDTPNVLVGISKNGLKIKIILNPDGTILTAYPFQNKEEKKV